MKFRLTKDRTSILTFSKKMSIESQKNKPISRVWKARLPPPAIAIVEVKVKNSNREKDKKERCETGGRSIPYIALSLLKFFIRANYFALP
jgi:hypothetical protein